MRSFIIKKIVFILSLTLIITHAHASETSPVSSPTKRIKRESTSRLLATPQDNIIAMIAADIDAVQPNGYIGIESPSVSNRIIRDKLIAAAARGAKVKIYVNDPARENNPNLVVIYDNLKNNDIEITVVPTLHAKRIVIAKHIPAKDTEKIVYIGSLNMTENSPHNHEIMMRCTDAELFLESYGDQHRLGKPYYNQRVPKPINVTSRTLMHSSYPEAAAAKKRVIEEFSSCTHPHDYLYIAAFTLDDPEIMQAIIQAKQRSQRPIKVILDAINLQMHRATIIKPLVLAGVDVYIFNRDQSKRTPLTYPKMMHVKAILRQCNQKCLSMISTANFTAAGKQDINQDLWEPCSLEFSDQLKRILDTVMQESEKLNREEFQPRTEDGTPQQMGNKLLELMKYNSTILANVKEILRLITAGADLTLKGQYGNTALLRAAGSGNAEIVQALIDAGADVNYSLKDHTTSLQIAVNSGRADIVQFLIDAGAMINFSDQYGNTPLFMATNSNHINIAKILIKAGADVNKPGDYREASRWLPAGNTPPLVNAVLRNYIELVKLLLEAGADMYAKDREGKTAFDRAAQNPQMLDLLNSVKFVRENAEQFQ